MKSKKEMCEITGISESTFNYWLGKNMIPEPVGIKKRRALWDDAVEKIIREIRRYQRAGFSLEQIKPVVAVMVDLEKNVSRRNHLQRWLDVDAVRDRIFELSLIERHDARIGFFSGMNDGRGLAFATVAHGDEVSFLEIDWTVEGEEQVLRRIDISKLEYIQFVADRQESMLKNNDILDINALGMMAFFPEFDQLMETTRNRLEYNKLAREIVGQVAQIKGNKTDG